MSQIARPCEPDPYAEQQLIEMKHCERCPYERDCTVYGEPYSQDCQSLKDWENTQ